MFDVDGATTGNVGIGQDITGRTQSLKQWDGGRTLAENKIPHVDAAELRRRAEERLEENRGIACPSESVEDQRRLVHELQVHQIELEMWDPLESTCRHASLSIL